MNVEFVEPKTLEEAETRRRELAADVCSIQAQLGTLNKTDEGRRLSVFEWEAWRKKAKAAHAYKCDELRQVKEWIRNYHRTYKATVSAPGGDSPEGILSDAGRGFNQLCDRFRAALDEIQMLQAENAALRSRLADYEAPAGSAAPGDRVDAWRSGYTAADAKEGVG